MNKELAVPSHAIPNHGISVLSAHSEAKGPFNGAKPQGSSNEQESPEADIFGL